MLNNVTVQGRLVSNAEVKVVGDNIHVTRVSIACDRDFKPKDGNERETDFFDIVAWRSTADFIEKYFSKGDMIVVNGRLQARTYENNNGDKRRVVEILASTVYFGGSRKKDKQDAGSAENDDDGFMSIPDGIDEELPFN